MRIFFKKFTIILLILLVVMPGVVFAQSSCRPGATDTQLCNGLGNVGTFDAFLARVFTFVGTLVGLIAVTMIVYSGFRMLISRGEPEGLKTAKAGFSYAVIGLVISVFSFVIVIGVQNFIGLKADGGVTGSNVVNNPLTSSDAQSFILNIVNGFLGLVGALASVMIVYNAFLYMTGGGNEDQIKKAKSGLLWSVVGFGTVLLAFVIITALKSLITS